MADGGRDTGVPVFEALSNVCPRCGERYFTASTMREIERLRQLKADRVRRKSVAVVSFGAA
jgi:hypothetical protein